jgi:hypothetical protein
MKKILFALLTFLSLNVFATHLRGGYISVERISGPSLQCKVTITIFTDLNSTVLFGGGEDVLDFGDGTSTLVPETPNNLTGFESTGVATYSVVHTFPAQGRFTISFREPNRNSGVINMTNSVGTTFYIETTVDLTGTSFSSTPAFLHIPVFRAVLGSDLSLSAGAISEEDYIVYYEIGTPESDRGTYVENYILPENFKINPFNGTISWDTKFGSNYVAGEYAFNIKVSLYKEVEGEFHQVCTLSKEIQIILEENEGDVINSTNVELDENARLYIPPNETKTIKLFFEKIDLVTPPDLSANSELSNANLSLTTYDSSTNENIRVGVLTVSSTESINRENPYLITVRARYGNYATDVSVLFFTQDVQPKLIDYVDIILETEDALASLQLYPNPTSDFIIISLPENQSAHVSLRDNNGRPINTFTTMGRTQLDFRVLSPGYYYCTIQSGRSVKQIKILKN